MVGNVSSPLLTGREELEEKVEVEVEVEEEVEEGEEAGGVRSWEIDNWSQGA